MARAQQWHRTPKDVFLGSHAVAAGDLTVGQLRGPRFVRLFRNVYVPAGGPISHATRAAAAALVVPPSAVLTGRSAAAVLGTDLTRPGEPVHLVVDESARFDPVPGLVVKRTLLTGADWRPGPTGRIASPPRLGFDLAREKNLRRAVAELDAVVRAGLVDHEALRRYVRGRHEHGVRPARAAAELCDPRAESLPESEVRVTLVQGGFAVTPQVLVRDNAGVICRADLAVDGLMVAIQYDGAWHALREQLQRDRAVLARARDAGWELVHLTAADNVGDPRALCDKVRRACSRANPRA